MLRERGCARPLRRAQEALVLTRPISSKRKALLSARAATMKVAPTPSEARLWSALVNRKLGVPFRRQSVVGGFIADFVAPSVKLIVEVDGGCHAQKRRAEARRDEKLARLGYRILRVEAALVTRDLPAAVALVRRALAQLAQLSG
jgi:very-short-patch-repair endonuclease